MKPVIAYYPVGTVHMRNLALLAGEMGEFDWRVLYRTRQPWFAPEKLDAYGWGYVCDDADRVPEALFRGDVRALVLSIAAVDGMVADLTKIKSLAEWHKKRGAIESAVLDVLGKLPKERTGLQVSTIEEADMPGYTRRRINYFVDDWTRTSAWLLIPEDKGDKEERPAILCGHSMVPQGKREPAGLEGSPVMALARHYAEQGYITLAPDCVTAGKPMPSS